MLEITSLKNGIVIDHINPNKGIKIFNLLSLEEVEEEVALILNARSTAMGKKDIIKIAKVDGIDLDAVSIIDPRATVNIIRDEKVVEKMNLELPEVIEDVITCQNPSCISTSERNVASRFVLINPEEKMYKCDYCSHIYDVEEWLWNKYL